MDRTALRQQATEILRENDRGGYTIPSARLYPHQWNWDSAFCSLGWVLIDPRRAASELSALTRGQWARGMIPHILFNSAAANYEPSPAVWKNADAPGAPTQVRTSSITQPPVAATAARRLHAAAGDDAEVAAALRALVPALERWHAWFMEARDPLGLGVPAIVHPWESGMDNAPRWDAAMKRIDPGEVTYRRVDDSIVDPSQRPTRYDYDRYIYLVNARAARGHADPVTEEEPFLVADVAMGAILCRAEEDLAELAAALGMEAPGALARRERLLAGLDQLYSEERSAYLDFDLRAGGPVAVDHVAGLLPLYAGGLSPARVEALATRLEQRFAAEWPVPTVPLDDPGLDARRYWRGPTWVPVNWLLVDGLERAGRREQAAKLAARTVELVAQKGFYEYYDPRNGDGLGADRFSWTAALTLDLLSRY